MKTILRVIFILSGIYGMIISFPVLFQSNTQQNIEMGIYSGLCFVAGIGLWGITITLFFLLIIGAAFALFSWAFSNN